MAETNIGRKLSHRQHLRFQECMTLQSLVQRAKKSAGVDREVCRNREVLGDNDQCQDVN